MVWPIPLYKPQHPIPCKCTYDLYTIPSLGGLCISSPPCGCGLYFLPSLWVWITSPPLSVHVGVDCISSPSCGCGLYLLPSLMWIVSPPLPSVDCISSLPSVDCISSPPCGCGLYPLSSLWVWIVSLLLPSWCDLPSLLPSLYLQSAATCSHRHRSIFIPKCCTLSSSAIGHKQ